MSDAHLNTSRPATTRRMVAMRIRRSSAGMVNARPSASAKLSMSYGLMTSAPSSSCAAPASALNTSTPSSSSRAATNSFATRFIPSCSELTTQMCARR